MNYKVTRPVSMFSASVHLPASKSISNRLLIIHALAKNSGQIENLSDSDDTRLLVDAISSENELKNIGPAGTSMRFLTAYYSCQPSHVRMTGSERMKERPIGPLVDALRLLGADIRYLEKAGFPPIEITGKTLLGGEIEINGGISSQFISALLMIAPYMKNGLILHLIGEVVSTSYIRMTLELMAAYGAEYKWEGDLISVFPGEYKRGIYRVESDWSGASYWYSMALAEPHPHLQLTHFEADSLQGDSELVRLFLKLGIVTEFEEGRLKISKLANVNPGLYTCDFTNSPDIVQTMAVALCLASVPFRFTGTRTLRIKETDRILALQKELKKLGYILESDAKGSFLSWNRRICTAESDPVIETYHDHRMAMAFAPVALTRGSVIIADPEVVSKSYPGFWNDLKEAGFVVEQV